MIVIGITGTDGKTTTVSLIYHILKTAGKDVSLISTVGAIINGRTFPVGFHVTNPSSFPLQQFIRRIKQGKKKERQYLVLEVTSHGIDQQRIWGIHFDIAGLTNITHEHLDYHKTYKNYVAVKAKFLQKAKIVLINADDSSYGLLQKYLKNKRVVTYGIKEKAMITPATLIYKTSLIGTYNTYNILLAIAVCKQLGISESTMQKGIQTFLPPVGRTEIVYKKDFTVMIDFAHTPGAFAQILPTLREQTEGKIIHVFGSAGERDRTKRPLMGEIASMYDDVIFLTAEDPRSESVKSINADIKKGIKKKDITVWEDADRQQAIIDAVALAKSGDLVLLTGKGHETSMNYGNGEISWNEFKAVEKALTHRK